MKFNSLKEALKNEPELTRLAIEFFTCKHNNNELYYDIKDFFDEENEKKGYKSFNASYRLGVFSLNDFMDYCYGRKHVENWFPGGISERVVEGLVKEGILVKVNNFNRKDYQERFQICNIDYLRFLKHNNLLENLLFGFDFIINKYKSSVILIEIVDLNQNKACGTGFVFNFNNSQYIVTNKHVIENAIEIFLFQNGKKIDFKDIYISENNDLAFFKIINPIGVGFYLSTDLNVLDEIITIGFPYIPMSKDAYQVFHKGEVNSFIEDYDSNNLFLISAKTSSGNSGSPVIDKNGSVLGIITKELFEKDLFYNQGKLPYYAAIPSKIIISELNYFEKIE